ncbi:MAG TPA: diguanylate cyclase [Ilumatobacter sp.]
MNDIPDDPNLTTQPGFHRRVLDRLPTPVIVVRPDGRITYGNAAIMELTGWTLDETLGENLVDYLHPDDAPWVLEAIANLTETASTDETSGATQWSSLRLRVLAKDGQVIPIEATGGAGLHDPEIQGLMYTVRPARFEQLVGEVFGGLARGESVDSLMRYVVEIVTLAPLGLEAAVVEQRDDGTHRVVAASHPAFESFPMSCTDFVPWAGLTTEPARADVAALPESARRALAAAGFNDCYHAGAHAPDVSTTLRLIACSRERHEPPMGVLQRVGRARELMSVALLKAHNDRMLEQAASVDDLTGLPNRQGLVSYLRTVGSTDADCAMLFVDVDKFKSINDRHGHPIGDLVLTTVADRLRRACRIGDLVFRMHGDEFSIVLCDNTGTLSHDSVRRVATRVVDMLAEPLEIDAFTLRISASVGVAYLGDDRDVDRLVSRADEAMYTAKRSGGGRHHITPSRAA